VVYASKFKLKTCVQGVRVKFQFQGEHRVVQLQRPLTYHNLQKTAKKICGKAMAMVFSTGPNSEVKLKFYALASY